MNDDDDGQRWVGWCYDCAARPGQPCLRVGHPDGGVRSLPHRDRVKYANVPKCRLCGARAGEPCVDPSGKRLPEAHKARGTPLPLSKVNGEPDRYSFRLKAAHGLYEENDIRNAVMLALSANGVYYNDVVVVCREDDGVGDVIVK